MDIPEQATRCVSLLKGLKDLPAASQHQREWAEDQLARFNLWAASLGVFAEAQFSITHRFAKNIQVSRVVKQLLAALFGNLYLYRCGITNEPPKQDELQSTDSDDGSSDSTSEHDSSSKQHLQINVTERSRKIQDGIGRLGQLAVRLRREGAHRTEARAAEFDPTDESGEQLAPEFESYIKVTCRRAFPEHNHDGATEERFQIAGYLQGRLRKTILDRWRRICYCRHHASDLAGPTSKPAVKSDTQKLKPKLNAVENVGTRDLLRPGMVRKPSVARKAVSTATTVPEDLKIDKKVDLKPRSTPTVTTKVRADQLNFPRAPNARDGVDLFICPFCGMPRPTKLLSKNQWQIHVMQDLAPYFCLFENCSQPHKTFKSSEDWLFHMKAEHARTSWVCQACHSTAQGSNSGVFRAPDSFKEHLEQQHPSSMSANEIALVLRAGCRNERPAFDNCLFCGYVPEACQPDVESTEYQRLVVDHMAKSHMQYFALVSLPWDVAGADDAASDNVTHRSQTSGMSEELRRHVMEDPEIEMDPEKDFSAGINAHAASLEEIKRLWPSTTDSNTEMVQKWLNLVVNISEKETVEDTPIPHVRRRSTAGSFTGLSDSDSEESLEDPDLATKVPLQLEFLRLAGNGDAKGLAGFLESTTDYFDVDCVNVNGLTALHLTAFATAGECIPILVDAGCDVDYQHTAFGTPLCLAAARQNYEVVASLLHNSPNVDKYSLCLGSAIHAACACGSRAIVDILLENGCELDRKRRFDLVSMGEAQAQTSDGHASDNVIVPEDIQFFAPEIESFDSEPMFLAAYFGHGDLVKSLIEHGAAVDATAYWYGKTSAETPEEELGVQFGDVEKPSERQGFGRNATALSFAARTNRCDVISVLLDSGTDIEHLDSDAATPAMNAAWAGSLEALELLVARGAALEQPGERSNMLHLAASKGHIECVRYILDMGLAVDSSDNHETTALMFASYDGHYEVATLLLDCGASVSRYDEDGDTPLLAASGGGHSKIANLLLARGAPVNHQNNDGMSALMASTFPRDTACLNVLLGHGANVHLRNSDGGAALNYAAVLGRLEHAKILLEAGAELETADARGYTPLIAAASEGHHVLLLHLVERGSNLETREVSNRNTPLIVAARNGRLECVRILIEQGANIEAKNAEHRTAVFEASESDKTDVLKLLIDRGASVDAQDDDGNTALFAAVNSGHLESLQLLVNAGASPGASQHVWERALVLAAEKGNTACLRTLLPKTSPDVRGDDEETALMAAAVGGHKECVRMLLEANASLDLQDAQGRSAVHHAGGQGTADCLRLLLERGARVDCRDSTGKTPLMRVVEDTIGDGGGPEFARLLLNADASILDVDDRGDTPLSLATLNGTLSMVKFLAGEQPDFEATDEDGFTALMSAARFGFTREVRALLEGGARLDFQNPRSGITALGYALIGREDETALALMEAGPHPPALTELADADALVSIKKGLQFLMKYRRYDETDEDLQDVVRLHLIEVVQKLGDLKRARDPVVALNHRQKAKLLEWADEVRRKGQAQKRSKKVLFAPTSTTIVGDVEELQEESDESLESEVASTYSRESRSKETLYSVLRSG